MTYIVDQTAKADSNVTQRNDDITPHDRIPTRLEDPEQQDQVLLAELRRDAHQLGQCECGGLSQDR